jgi:hypothetical protein
VHLSVYWSVHVDVNHLSAATAFSFLHVAALRYGREAGTSFAMCAPVQTRQMSARHFLLERRHTTKGTHERHTSHRPGGSTEIACKYNGARLERGRAPPRDAPQPQLTFAAQPPQWISSLPRPRMVPERQPHRQSSVPSLWLPGLG